MTQFDAIAGVGMAGDGDVTIRAGQTRAVDEHTPSETIGGTVNRDVTDAAVQGRTGQGDARGIPGNSAINPDVATAAVHAGVIQVNTAH